MSLKIVVINGIAQHGKDTFVKEVIAAGADDVSVINHSTVRLVKNVARRYFGADETVKKGDAERRLWSDLKDAWTRYNNGPFNEVVEMVREIESCYRPRQKVILFIHAREPVEIDKLKKKFGDACMTLLITNYNKTYVPDNHADQDVFDYEYDLIIKNDGTIEDLKQKADEFVATL